MLSPAEATLDKAALFPTEGKEHGCVGGSHLTRVSLAPHPSTAPVPSRERAGPRAGSRLDQAALEGACDTASRGRQGAPGGGARGEGRGG